MGWRKNSLGGWVRDPDENSRANRVWDQIQQPKTEGEKLEEEGGYIDKGDPITDDNIDKQTGRPLTIHKDASVRVKTGITDSLSENADFDEAVRQRNLEGLKKGVEIKRQQGKISLNPIDHISQLAESWDGTRQQFIDKSAQLVDDAITAVGDKLNIPGTDFVADRARNITGLGMDVVAPESWEFPFYAAAAVAEPTPLGEAVIYGGGAINRGRRLLKVGNVAAGKFVDDLINNVTGRITTKGYSLAGAGGGSINGQYFRITSDDLSPTAGPGFRGKRPLPGSEHVSGIVPQITGKFNGKVYNKTTLDPDLLIPWKSVKGPKGRELAGQFVQEGYTNKDFDKITKLVRKELKEFYPQITDPTTAVKTTFVGHHSGPVKQIAWSVNGLGNEARKEAVNYITKGIGHKLGMSPENLKLIPDTFHPYVHRLLNDALGPYDVSKVEKAMGLNPGGISKLELWDRKQVFDEVIKAIKTSNEDISTFMTALAHQSKKVDVDPEVFVDGMEKLLELQFKIKMKPGNLDLQKIINITLGQKNEALQILDMIPAAERPVKNMLFKLAIEDKQKALRLIKEMRIDGKGSIKMPDFTPKKK